MNILKFFIYNEKGDWNPKLIFISGTQCQEKSFKSDFVKLFKKGNAEEFARIINKNASEVTFS